MISRVHVFVAAAVASVAGTRARADSYVDVDGTVEDAEPSPLSMAWSEPALASAIGVGVTVGGGVTGFTDKTLRDTTSVGGGWNARVSLGTHVPLAFEAIYNGTATSINSLLGPSSATLIGTAFEGDARFNVMPHFMLDPYVFVGVGWQHYSINNDSGFTLSDTGIAQHDDLVSVPVGLGLAFRMAGFVAEARGTYRATSGATMVRENPAAGGSDFAHMHTWNADVNVGYEW